MKKTHKIRCIEMDRGKSFEVLIRERLEAGMTWQEIARDIGVTRWTLRDWVGKLGGQVQTTIRFASEQAVREQV